MYLVDMTTVFGYTGSNNQEIVGVKKNIDANILQYKTHNIPTSPRMNNV